MNGDNVMKIHNDKICLFLFSSYCLEVFYKVGQDGVKKSLNIAIITMLMNYDSCKLKLVKLLNVKF